MNKGYTYFANDVSCDGHKKLRNVEPKDGASCICVGSCLLIDSQTLWLITYESWPELNGSTILKDSLRIERYPLLLWWSLSMLHLRVDVRKHFKVAHELKYWVKCSLVFTISGFGLVLIAIILDPIVKKMWMQAAAWNLIP